ncbi:flagellar basal body-associated protein FliL [Nocardioides sp. R-C-SC26]|uniref:flagellar basal body-associated FliL family protein n=1 Tax=Nocardioides sp. R-C-SC26 TaxID=2870414 RepID=UPI001E2DE81E|nr:flagellar basal body-associated FliL family protein [Nocardioides sp. R-C-SC26]
MSTATATAPAAAPEKPGGKKKLIMIVAIIAIVGGGAYWFVLKPKPEPGEPVPGEVVPLDAIQVNLAGGHYLRLGLGLQLVADVHEEVDGSKALDVAIDIFSGRKVEELAKPAERRKLKKELVKELDHLYHGEVIDAYFREFVTQ